MTLPDRPDDLLRWQAFLYVADELDRDARAAFEERLGDDPDACAAVAEAVELLGACLAIDPPAVADRRPMRVLVGSAVALAAAAMIVLAMLPDIGDRPGQGGVVDLAADETIALEHAWARLQRAEPADESGAPGLGELVADLDDWEGGFLDDRGPPELEEDQGPDPPSWLMAAVELAGRPAERLPDPLEN